MEQFEAEMALAGYNEEQIAEAKQKLYIAVQETAQALVETMQQIAEQLASSFEQVKDVFAELTKLTEEVLNEESSNTKYMEPSKRLEYIDANRISNEVVRRYYNRDIRSLNMNFTRYRQKH